LSLNLPCGVRDTVLFALVFIFSVIISPKRKIAREKYGAGNKD